ncbi:Rossmann-fold NAD(P)-binding domain-containing protein [Bdellovibrio reynosensis]|uniref:Shikimate dehydrogenase n=1 Tax=Bdellovibrio reynosensis TaxID=2835041 RepID=A0ABY4CFF0_9BACT|nr:hypothetical protein [Bdellovibrio reynosensis]UOF02401.1 hypothetical protein MNR06_05480 [Bdellovibrio reynosensis]
MKNHKIVEFTSSEPGLFVGFLQFLAREQNWDWQFETLTDFSLDALQGASAAYVDTRLSKEILPQLKMHSTESRSSLCVDSFFKEENTWYPRLLIAESLRLILVQEARDLNNRAPGFVVGTGELARVAANVLAEVGVSEIYLVGESDEGQELRAGLMRALLGIKIHSVVPEDLTVQAISAGIIINTVDLSDNEELMRDLTYFNFMRNDGYVLDFNLLPVQNPLLLEATKAELKTLIPQALYAQVAKLWLERLEVGSYLSVEDLRESWMQFLKENSSSV